jgi:hypothetical protein
VELCNDGAQDRALSSVLLVPAGQEFRLFKSYLYEGSTCLCAAPCSTQLWLTSYFCCIVGRWSGAQARQFAQV